jgi:hypothetical protein
MNWFREHLKLGSRLALSALVLQFALSFGHFHAFAVQAAPATLTSPTKAAPANRGAVLTQDTATKTVQKQQPSNHDRGHPADACAICAVIALANTVLFATAAALLLPQASDFLHLTPEPSFKHLNSTHSAFNSRAPPLS